MTRKEVAAKFALAEARGFITVDELAISLGNLLGIDLRCQLGECQCVGECDN